MSDFDEDHERIDESALQKAINEYPPEVREQLLEDLRRIRAVGKQRYGNRNWFYEKNLGKRPLDSEKKTPYSKAMEFTVALTRIKFAKHVDPPVEQVTPLMVIWAEAYPYSAKYDPGIVLLLHNGEFRTYTQSLNYFKQRTEQIICKIIVAGGNAPYLPWMGKIEIDPQ